MSTMLTTSPRNLRAGFDWLIKEQSLLSYAVEAGADAFEVACALGRTPREVIARTAAMAPDLVGQDLEELDLSAGSEAFAHLLDLGLCAVPLKAALMWCAGLPGRPSASELEQLRRVPSSLDAIELADSLGIWDVNHDNLDDLNRLTENPLENIHDAIASLHAAFEGVTPSTILQCLAGRRYAPAEAVGPGFALAGGAPLGRYGKKTASTKARPTSSHSDAFAYTSSARGRRGRGRFARGRRAGGRSNSSTSYPSAAGAPHKDTRTAAERAWENRTNW